jgi:hypothetical protein
MAPPPEAEWAPRPQNWQPQQSFYPQEGEEFTDFQQIRRALDDTLARESELIGRVQNLTLSIATFQQREDLHTRQLDVLTEPWSNMKRIAQTWAVHLLSFKMKSKSGRTSVQTLLLGMKQTRKS